MNFTRIFLLPGLKPRHFRASSWFDPQRSTDCIDGSICFAGGAPPTDQRTDGVLARDSVLYPAMVRPGAFAAARLGLLPLRSRKHGPAGIHGSGGAAAWRRVLGSVAMGGEKFHPRTPAVRTG